MSAILKQLEDINTADFDEMTEQHKIREDLYLNQLGGNLYRSIVYDEMCWINGRLSDLRRLND